MMTCQSRAYSLYFFLQKSIAAELLLHHSGLRLIKPHRFASSVLLITNSRISSVHQSKRFYLLNHNQIGDNEREQIPSLSKNAISNKQMAPAAESNEAITELSHAAIHELAADLANNEKNKQESLSTSIERVEIKGSEKRARQEDMKTPLMDLMKDIPGKELPRIDTDLMRAMKNVVLVKDSSKKSSRDLKPSKDFMWKSLLKEPWQIEKERTKVKYPNGYQPLKKLSPDAMDGIRALHAQMPGEFTTARLSREFKISPEAIRRILKSKWRPNVKEALERESRWFKRGEQIWSRWAELGANPPKRFRRLGIGEKPKQVSYRPDPLPELVTTSTRPGTTENNDSGSKPEHGGLL